MGSDLADLIISGKSKVFGLKIMASLNPYGLKMRMNLCGHKNYKIRKL
jgi:hypothetical protein